GHAEPLSDPSHRQRPQALGVVDLDRRPGDPVDTQPLLGSLAGRLPESPQQLDAAAGVPGAGVLRRHAHILAPRGRCSPKPTRPGGAGPQTGLGSSRSAQAMPSAASSPTAAAHQKTAASEAAAMRPPAAAPAIRPPPNTMA